jgi:predicted nucleic acid-binding protein
MICIDSSVAAKWILEEEWTTEARALYDAALNAGELIVAPPLLPIEVTNVLRQRLRRSPDYSLGEALAQLDRFLGFSVEIRNPSWLHRRALQIADAFGLPAAYDAHYLALADELHCPFWTADRRLALAVGRGLGFVRLLGEYDATADSSA